MARGRQGRPQAVGRDEHGRLGDVLPLRVVGDVVEGGRVGVVVQPGVGEPERDAAAALDQVGLEPGEHRRRQAGAAVDLVEVPDLVVPDGDRHPDLVAEVPVAQCRHIRNDAHAHAVDDVLRRDTLLVVGLGERLGNAAGAALTELSWRRRDPGRAVLAEAGLLGLPEVAAVGSDGQARAADQRDPIRALSGGQDGRSGTGPESTEPTSARPGSTGPEYAGPGVTCWCRHRVSGARRPRNPARPRTPAASPNAAPYEDTSTR